MGKVTSLSSTNAVVMTRQFSPPDDGRPTTTVTLCSAYASHVTELEGHCISYHWKDAAQVVIRVLTYEVDASRGIRCYCWRRSSQLFAKYLLGILERAF